MSEFQRYVLKPDIRKTSEIKKHYDNAPGQRWVFLDRKKLPEASLYTIVRTVEDLVEGQSPYIDPHSHNCDSEFLFIGDGPGMTGLTAHVWLGEERFVIESPASVFIPKDVLHNVQLIKGSGKFVNIVLHPVYNDTLEEEKK
jgi:2-isopropylmalate synthase